MDGNNPKGLHGFLNVFFVILLFVPMLGMIAGVGTSTPEAFMEVENRRPASFPNTEWTWSGMAAFPKALDQWFSDRFGFRRFLIDLNGRLDVQVLKVSPDLERVVLGKQGWMFLGDRHEHVFSKHSGQATISEADIHRFVEDRRNEKKWLASRGIRYIVAIAPDKHTIYPEYLPAWVRLPRRSLAADQAVELLEKSGVHTIDLRPHLLSAKKDHGDVLYHKTGTHWTDLGAYIAYINIIKGLEDLLGPLNSIEMKSFTTRHHTFRGALSTMARVGEYVDDYNVFMAFEQDFNSVMAYEVSDPTPSKPLWEDPAKRVPRTLNAEINNTRGLNNFRVVFIRDSFLTRMTHLLNQSFRQCVYTEPTYEQGWSMKDLVTKYQPDIVVFQIVERKVPDYRPRTDARAALGSDVGS